MPAFVTDGAAGGALVDHASVSCGIKLGVGDFTVFLHHVLFLGFAVRPLRLEILLTQLLLGEQNVVDFFFRCFRRWLKAQFKKVINNTKRRAKK